MHSRVKYIEIRHHFITEHVTDGDINIDLVDRNGNVLATSQSTTDNERINYIVNSLDTYYIRVYMPSGHRNTYTFWWDDIWHY